MAQPRVFKRKGSELYYFRVQRDGEVFQESTGERDRKAAQAVAARRVHEISLEGRTDRRARREVQLIEMAAADLAEAKARGVSDGYYKALEIYWRNLRDFYGPQAPLAAVTFESVRAYEGARRAAGVRGQSIREEVSCLKRAFSIAKRRRRIHRLPDPDEWPEIRSDPPDARRKGKLISVDVLRQVLERVPKETAEDLMFDVLTGLRSAELGRVRASWLREDTEEFGPVPVLFVPAEASKTRSERVIPLPRAAREIFDRRAKLFGADLLFRHRDHRKQIAKACLEVGFAGTITMRDLRATYATLARRGGDAVAVRDLLGHTRYEMTNTYLKSDLDGLVDAGRAVARAVRPRLNPKPRSKRCTRSSSRRRATTSSSAKGSTSSRSRARRRT
jgi:site-specific recombinase XerC